MLDELMDDDSDCLWLTYSANYLLRTGGVRWAVDPLTVHGRFQGRASGQREEISVEEMRKLEPFSFVLLTHNHDDHLDISLAKALRDFPIKWVMPSEMKAVLKERDGAKDANIIIPEYGKPLVINGAKITAFEWLHRRVEPFKVHIPSNIYLVETAGRRFLFPGDVKEPAMLILFLEFAFRFSPENIWKKLAPGVRVFIPEIGERVKLS